MELDATCQKFRVRHVPTPRLGHDTESHRRIQTSESGFRAST